jgi:hypothetical protein
MKGLLIIQNDRISTFHFELWYLRQKLRFSFSTSVAITTIIHRRSVWIFLKQIRGECGHTIGGPHRLVRRMLERFGRRLRRVVALDAGNFGGTVRAAILVDVIGVIERYRPKFSFERQNNFVRRLLAILRG